MVCLDRVQHKYSTHPNITSPLYYFNPQKEQKSKIDIFLVD